MALSLIGPGSKLVSDCPKLALAGLGWFCLVWAAAAAAEAPLWLAGCWLQIALAAQDRFGLS